MSKDWGLRVSRPGYSVVTGTDPQMVMSSKFDNLRIHSRGTGTIYDSTGRTHTIAHNLGYVPMYVVHSQPDIIFNEYGLGDLTSKYFIAPINPVATDIGNPPFWNNRNTITWADSTNIYIKVEDNFGYEYAFPDNDSNNYGEEGDSYMTGWMGVGRETDGSPTYKGAIRFNNVAVDNSVHKATISIYLAYVGSKTTPVVTYGIDEDDPSDFAGNPMGRTRTTEHVHNSRDGGLGQGNNWAYEVTGIFNEIISRSGFNSGNHVGFLMEDDGSTQNDTYFETTANYDSGFPFYEDRTYLKWLKNNLLTNYRYTIFKNKIV